MLVHSTSTCMILVLILVLTLGTSTRESCAVFLIVSTVSMVSMWGSQRLPQGAGKQGAGKLGGGTWHWPREHARRVEVLFVMVLGGSSGGLRVGCGGFSDNCHH